MQSLQKKKKLTFFKPFKYLLYSPAEYRTVSIDIRTNAIRNPI